MTLTSCFGRRCHELGEELWVSTEILFMSRLNWLLLLGPVALVGDATKLLGESICFACSGIALIPCAERLSFVTEQVAAHTNDTIGALLNATFGNAPELLISTFALRSGKYRVVQLAMLGSMLTNLLFVFGVSCLVGGLRWQVQELRITSGNVSVLMLLVATAGSLLPAALSMSGQMRHNDSSDGKPSWDELQFSRVNALIMILMYICYLMFQLGTHKEEFDEKENLVETPDNLLLMTPHFTSRHGRKKRAERNHFCLKCFGQDFPQKEKHGQGYSNLEKVEEGNIELMRPLGSSLSVDKSDTGLQGSDISSSDTDEEESSSKGGSISCTLNKIPTSVLDTRSSPSSSEYRRRHDKPQSSNHSFYHSPGDPYLNQKEIFSRKSNPINRDIVLKQSSSDEGRQEPQMSFLVGLIWLSIITLCISAMSDILVDTIDEFSGRVHISQVFTSMVILPFFSNVAEQVSAIIFAYRNKMDLCVGVTVGSAIQVATFVLPGSVLIGMIVDRSMTLFFRGYETCCLFLGVIVVAAVLQGGTTNWLVGVQLMGVYFMLAAGFWFHELEDLSKDEELVFQNKTDIMF
mmetsp:Transcript_15502/g.17205  ORF Transcript_15502/g.17205 Transcript_15502/m.17205 type:complete len:577 (-) Transcript_15502:207-1937(-)